MSIHSILFYLSMLIIKCSANQFNLTQYREMPALFQLDDYDSCMKPNAVREKVSYCLIYAEIEPNKTSALWREIETTSKDSKHYFRHDHLLVGVCLERCEQLLKPLSRQRVQQLYSGKTTDAELNNYFRLVHKRGTDERIRYDRLINSCLNVDFQQRYHLKLLSMIEYCERAEEKLPFDALDFTMCFIFMIIITFTIASSLYDFRLKRSQALCEERIEFYQSPLNSKANKILTSFSLCRNYYRLVKPSSSVLHSNELRFFDAYRVIGVWLVILGHTLMIFMTVQLQNPEFIEQFLFRFETSILQNGSAIIQIFFVMSGFLLYVNFTDRQMVTSTTKVLECVMIYFKVFFYRYFRLVPSLIILILFNGTFLTRLQDGPLWRHITEPERVFCRENWWHNILFVNNYLLKESCAQQTWYLSADMQLFELFLIIIIITKKYPFLTRYINILLLIFTFAVPMCLTYFMSLEAVYHLNPENYRYLYFRNTETFYQIYPPFYTNLGGYLFGFCCAYLYLKNRCLAHSKNLHSKWTWQISMLLLLLAAFAILFSGFIFIKYDFEKPSVWLALYAGIYKNFWILICAVCVYCMCFKVGWIGYEFCCLPIFRPLAHISYQAFLWHVVVLRVILGYFRQPIYVNSFFMFCNVIVAFVLTNIIAFFIALLIEYPITELLNILFKPTQAFKPAINSSSQNQSEAEMQKV